MACRSTPLSTALTALLLAGCVSDDSFPSLAPRPQEGNISTVEPVREVAEVPADSALAGTVRRLVGQAAEGDRAFDAAHPPAQAAVAAAGGEGSESWIEAQQAISRLEAARAQTMQALVELDRMAVTRAEMPTNSEDLAAVQAAVAGAERIAAGQQQRLDALRARLNGR